MTKTIRKALSLLLSIVLVFSLTMAFTGALTTYAALNVDGAKQIALNDSGLAADKVTFTQAKADGNEFDIEFRYGQAEYDYEISGSGEILSFSYDSNKRASGNRNLSADAAESKAVAFIGSTGENVKNLRSEYDDNEYEVSFVYGDKAYDVTVSAVDGAILEYDYEVVQTASDGIISTIAAFFQRIIAFFSGFFA